MEAILRQFIDCEQVVAIDPFGHGHINDTYRAAVLEKNGRQTYLLQRLNHHVFPQPLAVMENIRLLAEHLSRQDFSQKISAPVPTLAGKLLHVDGKGNYWRLFPFFENTATIQKVENPAQAQEAARAFGAFAKALDGMDVSQLQTTIPHFHDGVFRMKQFRESLAAAKIERRAAASPEIEEVLQNEAIFQKVASLDLPLRAVHHDTKINNLLFDAGTGRAVAVVDLDTVMPGTVLSDFGDLVRTSASPAGEDETDLSKIIFRKEIYGAILEGFLSEMGPLLSPAERAHLPLGAKWLTLMQAVRFLTDHLAGDVYYRTAYPGHNLARTRNQLALFRSMKELG